MPFLAGIFPPELIAEPKTYRLTVWTICYRYFLEVELPLSMIVVLLVGPSLISQDLRFNALPLYFSRPLRRWDYFVGKLGVIAWFLGMVIVFPSLLAWGLGLLFSLDVTIVWDTAGLLLACLAYGAVVVVSAGTLILALSSLSRNSRYIALFWVALWFVSSIVATILAGVDADQRRAEHDRKQRAQKSIQNAQAERWKAELEASRHNWRPLVSYTGNLSRIGQYLLGVDAAWEKWSRLRPPEERDQFLADSLGPQYPWYWSAGVLAVLLGLSACILNYQVRSLDRLK